MALVSDGGETGSGVIVSPQGLILTAAHVVGGDETVSYTHLVLSFISLISAFCIMAVMFTVSIQRKKEIAVMKALGATPFLSLIHI